MREVQTGYGEKLSPLGQETRGAGCPGRPCQLDLGGFQPRGVTAQSSPVWPQHWACCSTAGPGTASAPVQPQLPATLGCQMHPSKCYWLTWNLLSEVKLNIKVFFSFFFFNRRIRKEVTMSHPPNSLDSNSHWFRLDLEWWSI